VNLTCSLKKFACTNFSVRLRDSSFCVKFLHLQLPKGKPVRCFCAIYRSKMSFRVLDPVFLRQPSRLSAELGPSPSSGISRNSGNTACTQTYTSFTRQHKIFKASCSWKVSDFRAVLESFCMGADLDYDVVDTSAVSASSAACTVHR
jgi:hypothetical protein